MLMRWSMLLEMFLDILACYCAMIFGERVENNDHLHRTYRWRGKDYLI